MKKKDYLIRFEDGKRVASILIDNEQDQVNKEKQAEEWAKSNPKRTWLVSDDDRNYIKLVNGKIKELTAEEIEVLTPKPVKSDLEIRVENLEKEVEKLKGL